MAEEESLVSRRSRRSTAGNRMEAALAELVLDDSMKEEDDVDFVNDKDEEDVFGSDFESTDEEAQADVEGGDKAVQEEEKRSRKATRSRLQKATEAAHAKHRVTFNPEASTSTPTPKAKLKRRVSLGIVIDAETGEVLDVEADGKKRHSQRKHTVMNTSATVKRMQKSEMRRATATPKKTKTESRGLTQTELIARALDNEEGNIVEHRDYLKLEEEKRKRARVVRPSVHGPLLRWVSRAEKIKVATERPPSPELASSAMNSPHFIPHPTSSPNTDKPTTNKASTKPDVNLVATSIPHPESHKTGQADDAKVERPPSPIQMSTTTSPMVQDALGSTTSTTLDNNQHTTTPTTMTVPSPIVATTPTPTSISTVLPAPPKPTYRTERVMKNYVVHELEQNDNAPNPPWSETMEVMFGDHVAWDELRVFVGKGRPLSRPKQTCPITGKQAPYMDPRTGVPFADARAYKVLSGILRHEYVWSPSLGSYVAHQREEVGGVDGGSHGVGGEVGGGEGERDAAGMDVDL